MGRPCPLHPYTTQWSRQKEGGICNAEVKWLWGFVWDGLQAKTTNCDDDDDDDDDHEDESESRLRIAPGSTGEGSPT
ncbi:hypothetical protein M0804_008702 [Polistes exclamans]|nr:hypothetical protein M0804_008702 [Polistes exclamans]